MVSPVQNASASVEERWRFSLVPMQMVEKAGLNANYAEIGACAA